MQREAPGRRIVIVGGGTAGWMTAAAIGRLVGAPWTVTLVESDAIGTIGVGEATIPQIHHFNAALGIDEDEFVRATGASFKLGIEFAGWGAPGERYIHAFGALGRPLGLLPFHHYWLRARAAGMADRLDPFLLTAVAAYAGRFARGGPHRVREAGPLAYAFHFDASRYAAFLRRRAEADGVRRREGRISRVVRDGESGDIAAIELEDGSRIAGDLFVDCSGFRGLLIEQELAAGYEDWTHWLPCDRALAVPCASALPTTPYTRATAHAAGWQWRIPLQHRTGNGLVYSSAHLSDDEAAATLLGNLDGVALAAPNPIRFVTGRRKACWSHNVVAIGLASGFLEPLESTSIHMIQSGIERLLRYLPNGPVAAADVQAYNAEARFEIERVRDFIILHYHANRRPEPFWQACRAMALPDSLSEKLALFRANGRIVRAGDELFTEAGWAQVLIGQGVIPAGWHPLADRLTAAELAEFLGLVARINAAEAEALPAHDAFIAHHCAMAAAA